MKYLKQQYQSTRQTEEEFLIPWIDYYKIIRDENDKYVYSLWGLAICCPDELEEFRQMEAFTFMEAVLFSTVIILNNFRSNKPNVYEIVKERYFEKLNDSIELHFLETSVNVEKFIEERFQFYFKELKALQNNELPRKIFSVFYDEDFYKEPDLIPAHVNDVQVKIFNKYLNKMFIAANQGSIDICRK